MCEVVACLLLLHWDWAVPSVRLSVWHVYCKSTCTHLCVFLLCVYKHNEEYEEDEEEALGLWASKAPLTDSFSSGRKQEAGNRSPLEWLHYVWLIVSESRGWRGRDPLQVTCLGSPSGQLFSQSSRVRQGVWRALQRQMRQKQNGTVHNLHKEIQLWWMGIWAEIIYIVWHFVHWKQVLQTNDYCFFLRLSVSEPRWWVLGLFSVLRSIPYNGYNSNV